MQSRRNFAKAVLAALGAGTGLAAAVDSKVDGVQLGVQTYSFRDMPLDAAIAAMLQIGIGECELFMGHAEPSGLTRDQLRHWRLTVPLSHFGEIRHQFDHAGIDLYAYSINFRDDFTEDELDRAFQMTRALGTHIITTSTTLTCAKRLVPFAAKYQVQVALHGHDETNRPNEFSSPESFAKGMAMSPDFFVNLDIGHFSSAGFDPVAYIRQHHDKILCLHIKDRLNNHGPAVPFGQGDTPIKSVLLLLKQKRYPIRANIEYEYNDDNPSLNTVVEVQKCFDYCKQILEMS